MKMSRLAQSRQRKCAIPPLIVDWLYQFGQRTTGSSGSTLVYFDKESKRQLRHLAGHSVLRRLDDMLDAYLVMLDERIVSVGRHNNTFKFR